jgi:hypothetical protein
MELQTFLYIATIGTFSFVALLGFALIYHWVRYNMNTYATTVASTLYITVSTLLLLALLALSANTTLV